MRRVAALGLRSVRSKELRLKARTGVDALPKEHEPGPSLCGADTDVFLADLASLPTSALLWYSLRQSRKRTLQRWYGEARHFSASGESIASDRYTKSGRMPQHSPVDTSPW